MAHLKIEIDHERARVELQGNLCQVSAMLLRTVQLTYARLNRNPEVGKAFRELIIAGVVAPGSPVWGSETGTLSKNDIDICAIIPQKGDRP